MTADRALIEDLRLRLESESDPERALGQRRYMKSTLPYLGVTVPRTSAITREVAPSYPLETYDDWQDTVLALFREATHREYWYAAVALAGRPAYREYARRAESLGLYETLVVEGAWWDIVDAVASDLVGGLYASDAAWLAGKMRAWSTDESMWKRRTAILSQLKRRAETDLPLLYDCIEPNLEDREFFIRKAIGWALREAAKTYPQEVIRYVEENRDALSPLSKREALRRVLKDGFVDAIP